MAATTGKELWKATLPTRQELLIGTDDTVVAVGSNSDASRTATALDRVTGRQRWTATLPTGDPVVGKGTLYGAGIDPANSSASPPSWSMVAVDLTSGQPRWRIPRNGPPSSSAITSGGVHIAPESPVNPADTIRVVAIDPTTGKERWAVATGKGHEPVMLEATDSTVYAIGPSPGAPVPAVGTPQDLVMKAITTPRARSSGRCRSPQTHPGS